MKLQFNIVDVVRMKDDDNTLFMVVDVLDFTKPSEIGQKSVIDIDLELMQVYPVMEYAKFVTISHNDVIIHARNESRDYKVLMDFIMKDRVRAGFFGTPDYLQIANRNIHAIKHNEDSDMTVRVTNGNPEQVITFKLEAPKQRMDIIRYDILPDVDACLDAINDLTTLHNIFGDDEYLQLKDYVINRIKYLQKK